MKLVDTGARLRVLLADDHALVREGLQELIEAQHDLHVVAAAGTGPDAVELARTRAPEIALVDVSMPGWGGVKLTETLMSTCPGLKIIAVTRHTDQVFVEQMMGAGARGYVLKQSASAELLRAIRAVASGERYIDTALRLDREPSAPPPPPLPAVKTDAALTDREEKVLRLIALAYSNEEISRRLNLTVNDVAALKSTAMNKTGSASRLHVVAYAQARGWM